MNSEFRPLQTVCVCVQLDEACKAVAPGVTTEEIDAVAHSFCVEHGAWPTGLGFRGFPKSCCTAVNEVVCHGIPDQRPLEEGDLLTIDCVVFLDGYHGDNARTVGVGRVAPEAEALALTTKESVWKAIEAVGPGVNYHELATVVHDFVARHGYSVIREYGGHGIGKSLHMPPVISFHPGTPPLPWLRSAFSVLLGCVKLILLWGWAGHMTKSYVMEVGHCFTIEPMIAYGTNEIQLWGDGWTVVTKDGACAQPAPPLAPCVHRRGWLLGRRERGAVRAYGGGDGERGPGADGDAPLRAIHLRRVTDRARFSARVGWSGCISESLGLLLCRLAARAKQTR